MLVAVSRGAEPVYFRRTVNGQDVLVCAKTNEVVLLLEQDEGQPVLPACELCET